MKEYTIDYDNLTINDKPIKRLYLMGTGQWAKTSVALVGLYEWVPLTLAEFIALELATVEAPVTAEDVGMGVIV